MRFPPKKILAAFDFSRRSVAAWRLAERLAQETSAQLEAVYVSSWLLCSDGSFVPRALEPAEQRAIRERMADVVGCERTLRIAEGDVVAGILEAARESQAELIVMATAGRTGLRRAAQGSVAETVVRFSPIPVLCLHGPAELPSSVLAPANLHAYSLTGVDYAADVARALGASLTVLHVKERALAGTAPLRRLELAAQAAGARAPTAFKVAAGRPLDVILSEAAGHGLVVLVAHRKGVFHDAVLGTTAEQILRRCSTPVLSVPSNLELGPASAPPPAEARLGLKGT